jgi:hypothetical protein
MKEWGPKHETYLHISQRENKRYRHIKKRRGFGKVVTKRRRCTGGEDFSPPVLQDIRIYIGYKI